MNTCESCKHWGLDFIRSNNWDPEAKKTIYFASKFRHCLRVVHAGTEGDLGVCDNAAAVVDGSGYLAELCTRADFGCVLHEGKP